MIFVIFLFRFTGSVLSAFRFNMMSKNSLISPGSDAEVRTVNWAQWLANLIKNAKADWLWHAYIINQALFLGTGYLSLSSHTRAFGKKMSPFFHAGNNILSMNLNISVLSDVDCWHQSAPYAHWKTLRHTNIIPTKTILTHTHTDNTMTHIHAQK